MQICFSSPQSVFYVGIDALANIVTLVMYGLTASNLMCGIW